MSLFKDTIGAIILCLIALLAIPVDSLYSLNRVSYTFSSDFLTEYNLLPCTDAVPKLVEVYSASSSNNVLTSLTFLLHLVSCYWISF